MFEDDFEELGCVLGDQCLVPDPFHTSDDCFDIEMAEALYFESDCAELSESLDKVLYHINKGRQLPADLEKQLFDAAHAIGLKRL